MAHRLPYASGARFQTPFSQEDRPMRKAITILPVLAALALWGCEDTSTGPRDVTPPAAPRARAPRARRPPRSRPAGAGWMAYA